MRRIISSHKARKLHAQGAQRAHNRRVLFRKVVIGGALIIGGYSLFPYLKRKGTEWYHIHEQEKIRAAGNITLTQARQYPALRQAFLDQRAGTNHIPYCEGVFYDHEGTRLQAFYALTGTGETTIGEKGIRNGMYDFKTPNILNKADQGNKTPILVGRGAFENPKLSYLTEGDFKHLILAHEAHHCRQKGEGLLGTSGEELLQGLEQKNLFPAFLYHIAEHDAYAHDLPRLLKGEFNASPTYIFKAKRKFITNGHNLVKASRFARPLELRLFYKIMDKVQQEPLLNDVRLE
jgi:hypothetical protein